MPSIQRVELVRALEQKFGFTPKGGSGHDRFELIRDGRKIAYTVVSRGRQYRELRSPIVSMISRQLSVKPRMLVGMVDCTVSEGKYLEHLEEREPG